MEIICKKICRYLKKIIFKCLLISIFLFAAIISIIIFISCYLLNLLSPICEIQNLILLLTAFIILWYTYETYELRVIDQKRLENEELPVLDLRFENEKKNNSKKNNDGQENNDKEIIKLKNISKGNAYYIFVVALLKAKTENQKREEKRRGKKFNNQIENKPYAYIFSKLSFFSSKSTEKFNEDDFYEEDNFGNNPKEFSEEIKRRWKALKLEKIKKQNVQYIKNILAKTIQYQDKSLNKKLDRGKVYLLFYLDVKCNPYCSFVVYNSDNTLVHKNSGKLKNISKWIEEI
jgi:hypothetical protein